MTALDDLAGFITALYGSGTHGNTHWARADNGYLTASGKYEHDPKKDWHPKDFAYPSLTGKPYKEMLEAAKESDVYVCVSLMSGDRRTIDGAIHLSVLHQDWDGNPADADACLDKVRAIEGFAVRSGTDGHLHVYVPLAEEVSKTRHRKLTELLGTYLGDGVDKGKKAPNDLLRPPGTRNFKGRARGGDPTDVVYAITPSGTKISPDAVESIMRTHTTGSTGSSTTTSATAGTTLPNTLPAAVNAALAIDTGDRSTDAHRVVRACMDAGIESMEDMRAIVCSRPDLAERDAEFLSRNPPVDDISNMFWKSFASDQERRRKHVAENEWNHKIAKGGQINGAPLARPAIEDASNTKGDGWFEDLVSQEVAKLQVRTEAKRRFEDASHPHLVLPPVKSLDSWLTEPDSEVRYLVEDLLPVGGKALLAAQQKAGKTTLVENLIRSLADRERFLGRFEVCRQVESIVLIDTELPENMLRQWLRDQRIENTKAVADVISLRGRISSFDLTNDRIRAQWAQRLRDLGCDFLIFDCLRPILDALGLDENHDAGTFLVAYDALLAEAGCDGDSVLVHHMGHGPERARGDSRLQDWPDALWRIVLEDSNNPHSDRFFSAFGRDVDVYEGRLTFDPVARRLGYVGGSRASVKTEDAMRAVIALLADNTRTGSNGLSKTAIEDALKDSGHTQKAIRAAILELTQPRPDGTAAPIAVETTARGAKICSIAKPCRGCGFPLTAGQSGRHKECPEPDPQMTLDGGAK